MVYHSRTGKKMNFCVYYMQCNFSSRKKKPVCKENICFIFSLNILTVGKFGNYKKSQIKQTNKQKPPTNHLNMPQSYHTEVIAVNMFPIDILSIYAYLKLYFT